MTTVAFRADASPRMGTGHVMRCLTLADRLRAAGTLTHFLVGPASVDWVRAIEARGHGAAVLDVDGGVRVDDGLAHSAWLPWGMTADARAALGALVEPVDWLVVDHYGLDCRWETRLRQRATHILAIDDLADRSHDCDLLLDHNLQPAGARYAGLIPSAARALTGPRFALLRPEFLAARPSAPRPAKAVERIAVFLGGGDVDAVLQMVLRDFLAADLRDLAYDVIVGAGRPGLATLQAFAMQFPAMHIHVATQEMAQLFATADLAIGAGGVAALERCTVGIGSITISVAANQEPGLGQLAQVGAVRHLGSVSALKAGDVAGAVRRLMAEPQGLRQLAANAHAVCDGCGADRMAAIMLRNEGGVAIRPARPGDSERTLAIRNSDTVRAASFQADPISLERHQKWFAGVLAAPYRRLWVVDILGEVMGTLRVDVEGTIGTVSIAFDAAYQRLGFGQMALLALDNLVRAALPGVEQLHALTRPDNEASGRMFLSAGYRMVETREEGEANLFAKDIR